MINLPGLLEDCLSGVFVYLIVSWHDDLAFTIRPNVVAGTMPNKAPTQKTQPIFKVTTLHEVQYTPISVIVKSWP